MNHFSEQQLKDAQLEIDCLGDLLYLDETITTEKFNTLAKILGQQEYFTRVLREAYRQKNRILCLEDQAKIPSRPYTAVIHSDMVQALLSLLNNTTLSEPVKRSIKHLSKGDLRLRLEHRAWELCASTVMPAISIWQDSAPGKAFHLKANKKVECLYDSEARFQQYEPMEMMEKEQRRRNKLADYCMVVIRQPTDFPENPPEDEDPA